MLGLALAVVGLALAAVALATAELRGGSADLFLAGATAVTGAVLMVAGLTAGSVRSLILRRHLGNDRYRGPSVLGLLAMVVIIANVAAVPFIGDVVDSFAGRGDPSGAAAAVALLIGPVTMAGASVLFVILPGALPGVRLLERNIRTAAWNFVLGVLIAGPAWVVALATSLLSAALLGEVIGLSPDNEVVADFIASLHPLVALFAGVVAAPIAEELFFRGVAFNAWEREYGYWRALIFSSLLFAVIHLSLFSFLPILLLALLLGYVYARTRSLLTVIGIHATFNAISIGILLLRVE